MVGPEPLQVAGERRFRRGQNEIAAPGSGAAISISQGLEDRRSGDGVVDQSISSGLETGVTVVTAGGDLTLDPSDLFEVGTGDGAATTETTRVIGDFDRVFPAAVPRAGRGDWSPSGGFGSERSGSPGGAEVPSEVCNVRHERSPRGVGGVATIWFGKGQWTSLRTRRSQGSFASGCSPPYRRDASICLRTGLLGPKFAKSLPGKCLQDICRKRFIWFSLGSESIIDRLEQRVP